MNKKVRNIVYTMAMTAIVFSSCTLEKASKEQDENIILTGEFAGFKADSTSFSYIAYALLGSQQYQNVAIAEDGSFKTQIQSRNPIKGFFSLGKEPTSYTFTIKTPEGQDSTITQGTNDFRLIFFYLQPGDSVHVTAHVDSIGKTLTFSGDGVDNNKFVNQEEQRFNDYKHKFLKNFYLPSSYSPNAYKAKIDEELKTKLAFLEDYADKHAISSHLKEAYQWDYQNDATVAKIYYPTVREGFTKKPVDLPTDYFDFMQNVALADQAGDKGIGYFYFLDAYLRQKYKMESSVDVDYYDFVEKELDGKMRYEYFAFALGRDFKKQLFDRFGDNCPYPEIAALVHEKYKNKLTMLPGNPAPQVQLTDPDGKEYTFANFKGKYIYIDFWATWCGPCIKEIPSLKQLEKDYHGKDIAFLSISFDSDKDVDKWKKFVVDNQLVGWQVIAQGDNHDVLSKAWDIRQIPRFVLLDKAGKIVDVNAPFPSSKEVRKLFDSLDL